MVKPSPGSARIDWRKLAAIEVNSFEQELRNQRWSVEEIGNMVAFSFIDSEFDLRSLDQNFVKLFKLTQVLLGYLLEKYSTLKNLQDQIEGVHDVTQENRKLRKLLDIYKQAFAFGGISGSNDHFQCPNCPKAFGDASYLQSHIYRRHPETSLDSKGMLPLARQISQYQSNLLSSTATTGTTTSFDDVKKELDELKDELKKTEHELNSEKEARMVLQNRFEIELTNKMKELEDTWAKCKQEKENQDETSRSKLMEQINIASSPSPATEDPPHQAIFEPAHEPIRPSSLSIVPNAHEIESKAKDLTGLLLVHTQEVRNLGNKLEKFVDTLCNGSESRNNVTPIPSPSTPRSTMQTPLAKIEHMVNNRRLQAFSYIDAQLDTLGIKSKTNISSEEFKDAMKIINERRRRRGVQEKVDRLKEAIDCSIKTQKIGETLNTLNQQQRTIATKFSPSEIEKSDLQVQKSSIESIPSSQDSSQQSLKDGSLFSLSSEGSDGGKKQLRSVLVIRDKDGKKMRKDESKSKRRIHFSDTRIEISPEYSSDEDDFDRMVSDSSYATVQIHKVESKEDNLETPPEEQPPIPKPRTSKPLGIDDHLRATDLKWFDSDGSDIDEELEKEMVKKSDNATGAANIDSNGNNQEKISVQELTKIIEEQLHNRATNRRNLANSVDAVTGASKTTGHGVKAIGTLTYDTDSE